MSIIYIPSGRAREYSELACNLYSGCKHSCKYCFAPAILRKSLNQWSQDAKPRKNIIALLEKDAKKLAGCDSELLFSFMADVYQDEEAAAITRQALLICEKHNFQKVNILTKAGHRAMADFDILERNKGWKFGSTIIFKAEKLREQWESQAPAIETRYKAVQEAHRRGIFTWVSVEPVVDPGEALQVIRDLKPYVNFWKVGKLNHFAAVEKTIDWKKFLADVKVELSGSAYYIKKDLAAFENK